MMLGAHETAADHRVDVIARDVDVGKLAVAHGAELIADTAAVVSRADGRKQGIGKHFIPTFPR